MLILVERRVKEASFKPEKRPIKAPREPSPCGMIVPCLDLASMARDLAQVSHAMPCQDLRRS